MCAVRRQLKAREKEYGTDPKFEETSASRAKKLNRQAALDEARSLGNQWSSGCLLGQRDD